MKLARIGRIVKILTTMQSGQNYTPDELAEQNGVSRRTIFRDLQELEAVGVPFNFDAGAGGYTIEPEFFLPSIDLNISEALSLLMLVHKGRSHLPLPFVNSALRAGIKIETNLPDNIRDYCNATLHYITIRPNSHAPLDQLDHIFAELQKAIRASRKVKIDYFSLYDKGLVTLTLDPYHLFYNNRAWYVTGKSWMHKEIRTFKLNRIRNIEPQKKGFVQDKKFDIHDYIGLAWSMIPEGKIYNIKLKFSKMVAYNVSEVVWHKTQMITRNDDGTVTLEFRVDGLGEISWWILGYGDQVEVLKPKALRDRIVRTAQNIVNNYSK